MSVNPVDNMDTYMLYSERTAGGKKSGERREWQHSEMKLDDLQKGDVIEGESYAPSDKMPPWMDKEKFQRGQRFFLKHLSSATLAMHVSLTTGLSLQNLLDPLVFTGQSDTPEKSLSRYKQTFNHILLWCIGDVWDCPDGKAYKSVQLVRSMHNKAREKLTEKIKGKKHITQYDMSLVQLGFMGALVMYPRKFGVYCTDEELDDYVFFWRGIGYLLGITDDNNICSGNFEETYKIAKKVEQEILLPYMRQPPKDFQRMADAHVQGMNSLVYGVKLCSVKSMFVWAYDCMGVPRQEKPSWPDMFRLWYWKFSVFLVAWIPGFRCFWNRLIFTVFDKSFGFAVLQGLKPVHDLASLGLYAIW